MYQCLVGRLIYLSHNKWSDIAYVISVIGQFKYNLREVDFQAAHQVIYYLRGTLGNGILFKRNGGPVLETYVDADYATPPIKED